MATIIIRAKQLKAICIYHILLYIFILFGQPARVIILLSRILNNYCKFINLLYLCVAVSSIYCFIVNLLQNMYNTATRTLISY